MGEPQKPADVEEIRVVDRRRFTAEGERRSDAAADEAAPPEPAPPMPSETPAPDPAQTAANRQAEKTYESRRPRHEAKLDFRSLVVSLSTSAMYQLGLVREPGAPPPQPDLEAARQTIDMLAVLEEKTRGNLTAEEKQLLEQVLYELRVSYVALSRR